MRLEKRRVLPEGMQSWHERVALLAPFSLHYVVRDPVVIAPMPRDALEAMHEVDLAEELRRRVSTVQSPPGHVRGALKNAMAAGLAEVQRDPGASDGWKLFLLAPRLLLHRRPHPA